MDRFQTYWRFSCTVGDTMYPLRLTFNRVEENWFLEQAGDMFKTRVGDYGLEDGNLVCNYGNEIILTLNNLNFLTVEYNDSGTGTALHHKVHMQWQFIEPDNHR